MSQPARRRSLWPREHGAYAQLAAPLSAALLVGTPTWPSLLFVVAAIAAFLANEPLLVLLGHRGARLKSTEGQRARRRAFLLAIVALVCGVLGLYVAERPTQLLAAAALLAGLGLVALAWRRAQHSIAGELAAAIALPAAAVPVASASGVEAVSCLLIWLSWAVGYSATVVAVHRVLARHRAGRQRIDVVLMVGMGTAVVGCVAAALRFPAAALAVPLVAISAILVARPPRANRLRTIGIALVIASTLSVAIAAR